MPNTENINRLIEAIRNSDTFDMSAYRSESDHPCGTPHCIAGFSAWLMGDRLLPKSYNDQALAADFLGIDDDQATCLFTPSIALHGYDCDAFEGDPGYIYKSHAIATLKHLRDTGEASYIAGKAREEMADAR